MNGLEYCLLQIERTRADMARETLANVRAKYERSLHVWMQRADALEKTLAGRPRQSQ